METITARQVDERELAHLDEVAATFDGDSRLRAALTAVADLVRAGTDVVIARRDVQLTPAQAASMLGMSRTHLYKVMDRGALPFVRVGRDRRIAMSDLDTLWAAREEERKALAERIAHRDTDRQALVHRLAGVDARQAGELGF